MSTEHERLAARLRHPSNLWTATELSAPVEAIWTLELAEMVGKEDDPES